MFDMNHVPVLEFQNVSFNYGCHNILDNINFTVFRGESVGIVGPNGSGKTTLLRLIMGNLKPSCGTVKLFGLDSSKFNNHEKIGCVPQKALQFNQSFPITVNELVATGRINGKSLFRPFNKNDRNCVHSALEQVGMSDVCNNLLSSLSGGQQQRVFIARALARDPQLLLLDEPTNNLDRAAQEHFYHLMKCLVLEKGLTIIIVSHELENIAPIITRQICLSHAFCTCSCHNTELEDAFTECTRRLWSA